MIHGNAVGSSAGEYLSYALFGAAIGVGQVIAWAYATTHHLEVAHFSDMGLHACLEEENAFRAIAVGGYLFAAGVVHHWHLAHERHHVAQEFHESAHAHVLFCADAEHGEDGAGHQAFSDAFAHLVYGQYFFLEEFLHQRFVVFGGRFNQCLVHLCGLFHFLGGDVFYDWFAALGLPAVFLHYQYVYQRVEARSCLQRILHGYALLAINVFHGRDYVVEVALVAVQLVNQEDDGLLQLLGITEDVLRAHFGAILSIDEDDGLVSHVE